MKDDHKYYLLRLGNNLRTLRESKGLTQLQLSIDAGVANSRIGEIENGKGNPRFTTLVSIALAMDVDVEMLTISDLKKH